MSSEVSPRAPRACTTEANGTRPRRAGRVRTCAPRRLIASIRARREPAGTIVPCEKAGLMSELRKRQHYEKPSVKRKRKTLAARKKAKKRERFFD